MINLSELDNRLVAKIKPETTDEELSEEQKAALEKERKIKEEERERQKKIEEARSALDSDSIVSMKTEIL